MSAGRGPRVVVLGMMTKMPVAGVVWQTLHYLLGLRALGFDVHYVEAHARTPSMLMTHEADDGGALAAGFVDRVLRRFDLGDRWAYQALHDDGRCYGLGERRLRTVYRSAELILNLHGGTQPRPEHYETGRLVYLETDPVQLQIELDGGFTPTLEFLEPHCAFFTFAENWGAADCGLPPTDRFHFVPTRQPVALDLWPGEPGVAVPAFTTVASWRQPWRDVTLAGTTYTWSKDAEFWKVLDLPRRTGRPFELVLSGCGDDDRARLVANGWRVREAAPLSADIDAYRSYLRGSLAEFTVAKDQNVRLRSGWFSDRSATYLAAGRPVITQDTGFGRVLPTGAGLFSYATPDEAVAAVDEVSSDYERHRRAAAEIAREHFAAERVLGRLVTDVGVPLPNRPGRRGSRAAIAADLVLAPVSRRPLRLSPRTVDAALRRPVPFGPARPGMPTASVVVVTHDNLVVTRLCLESILANTDSPAYEVIVVDNASTDGTRRYLATLARRLPQVRVIANDANVGFPRAGNQGLEAATGRLLVVLNNDTVVTPGWLSALTAHLADPALGLIGPVTNRIGNEAEVEAPYRTYGELLAFARARARAHAGESSDLPTPAMFCVALRDDVWRRLGRLDERFGLGTLEDDDYALRARRAGYRTACAEDAFVHHFGEATFGRLVPDGEYARILRHNQRLFEEKWDGRWEPYARRRSDDYEALKTHVRAVVGARVPSGCGVIVVSRGDDELLSLDGRRGLHFPQTDDGVYAGHYPADSAQAIAALESVRRRGGDFLVVPRTGFWWLDHYAGLAEHLARRAREVTRDDACVLYALNGDDR